MAVGAVAPLLFGACGEAASPGALEPGGARPIGAVPGSAAAAAASGKPPSDAAAVEVVRAEAPTLERAVRRLGRAEAPLAASIAAPVAAVVKTVGPREGDAVKAGEALATLDDGLLAPRLRGAQAEVARVSAELRLARAELGRLRTLGEAGSALTVTGPERERQEARVAVLEAGLAAARAAVDLVEAERARHVVTAPFDGTVAARHLDPGAWAAAGAAIVDLVGAGPVEVFVEVPAEALGEVTAGAPVALEGAAGGPTIPAVVRGVGPSLEPATQGVRLRVSPEGEAATGLRPGAPVHVILSNALTESDAVRVPLDAVKRGPDRAWLYVVPDEPGAEPDDGPDGEGALVPRRVEVVILARGARDALVRGEGLTAGARVITRGNERLRPGQTVRVAPSALPAPVPSAPSGLTAPAPSAPSGLAAPAPSAPPAVKAPRAPGGAAP